MITALIVLALFGPPKLPPIGGRAVPPPVEPVAPTTQPELEVTPAPSTPASPPAAPAPPRAPPSAPPSAPPATNTTTTVGSAPAGPEVLANGPTSPTLVTPRLPGGPAAPGRMGTMGAEPSSPTPALRLVSSEELAGWEHQDAAPRSVAGAGAVPSRQPKTASTVVRTATPQVDTRPKFTRPPHPPDRSATVVLGYRFFRIQDALGRPQDWHLASIEVTPLRRFVRLNLLTEFGVEGGEAARSGDRADILLMQRLGLGMQYPHVVTPFLEFQGGAGGARIELFGRNDVALLYTLGLDLGAQWALGNALYIHAAIGWIRPTFVWPERTLSYDRVAFKLGIGF